MWHNHASFMTPSVNQTINPPPQNEL